MGGNRRQRFWLVFPGSALSRFSVDCQRLQPRGSIKAPSRLSALATPRLLGRSAALAGRLIRTDPRTPEARDCFKAVHARAFYGVRGDKPGGSFSSVSTPRSPYRRVLPVTRVRAALAVAWATYDPSMKHAVHLVQTFVVNPLVKLGFDVGISAPGDALLETTGRTTGRPRRTPVCDCGEGDTFWLIAQTGRDAEFVRNIQADPRVRVKLRRGARMRWRAGTAHIVDDDDPRERRRVLSQGNFWRGLCLSASSALATSPLTLRIDLDPE
jgi:deazaflavin-dependent oxidoreductase (nitroreductase family)